MDKSGDKDVKEGVEPRRDKHMNKSLEWILMVSVSPIAFLLFILMALYTFLRFLYKATLLFIIVAINTPFAVMYNVSIIVFRYNPARFRKYSPAKWNRSDPRASARVRKPSSTNWNWSDPRASVGIEIKLFVSDFLKVVAGEIILFFSAGIITYYTAPVKVFYLSTSIGVVAIIHKWLNTDCISKTVLSCLCDGYGLSPMMFLFSYIGFFDIGCHPIAKCSFVASQAFLFIKDDPKQLSKVNNQLSTKVDSIYHEIKSLQAKAKAEAQKVVREIEASQIEYKRTIDYKTMIVDPIVHEIRVSQIDYGRNPNHRTDLIEKGAEESDIEEGHSKLDKKDGQNQVHIEELGIDEGLKKKNTEDFDRIHNEDKNHSVPIRTKMGDYMELPIYLSKKSEKDLEQGDKKLKDRHRFNGAVIGTKQFIEFSKWNAFERGLFHLSPRINFIKRDDGKCILKSFMVLKLVLKRTVLKQLEVNLCEYPVERLELPEDYSKANELYNFLVALSEANGFVTDKMRGRYEHSLTLLEIAEGVEENDEYRIVPPKDNLFVVA